MPEVIESCAGITVFSRLLKSFLFTTDLALIKNTNADAVMAVYPFTSMPSVNNALVSYADMPVFCGIGGLGIPVAKLLDVAKQAEHSGASGVVANVGVKPEEIAKLKKELDIPVVVTAVSMGESIERKLDSGADIINVSGAAETCDIIGEIRARFPYVPIIATGGPSDDTILRTIKSGADAISFTPPTNAEIFRMQMKIYRENLSRP
jgi:DhnA family fructose-bisphosphate aldolase class Ia